MVTQICTRGYLGDLQTIRSKFSLDCQSSPELYPNCTGRVVRSAGRPEGSGRHSLNAWWFIDGYPPHTCILIGNSSTGILVHLYSCTHVCTVPVLDTNTAVKLVCGAAHASQLIHFSSVPCTTIYFQNPLGLGFPALHSTSSSEVIQTRFSTSKFYSHLY
eukprot:COSAG02_NODE_94_length_37427_cov_79.161728_22_plen_160_part_00